MLRAGHGPEDIKFARIVSGSAARRVRPTSENERS